MKMVERERESNLRRLAGVRETPEQSKWEPAAEIPSAVEGPAAKLAEREGFEPYVISLPSPCKEITENPSKHGHLITFACVTYFSNFTPFDSRWETMCLSRRSRGTE